jgi:hypothetical protein
MQGANLGAYSRRRGDRRPSMAEAGCGGRWRGLLRCVAVRPEQPVRVVATGSPMAGRSSTCWRCKRPKDGARRGYHWRRQWWLGGSIHTRVKDGGKLLKPSSRRWRSLLALQGSKVVAWAVAWPRYDGSAIGRAARSAQPARAREARGAKE